MNTIINRLTGVIGLAVIAWLSIFVQSWLFIMGEIPFNGLNIVFWMFFVFVAISASAMANNKRS